MQTSPTSVVPVCCRPAYGGIAALAALFVSSGSHPPCLLWGTKLTWEVIAELARLAVKGRRESSKNAASDSNGCGTLALSLNSMVVRVRARRSSKRRP